METPREHETTLDQLEAGEALGLVEAYVSESEYRVYDALARLQGGAEFWCGSQDDLAAFADYDKRTVRTATRRLEGRGLLRTRQEPGRPIAYFLTASPDGRPFVVRRRDARRGRDVVRDARPVGLAQSQIDALVSSLREDAGAASASPDLDLPDALEGADQGGGSEGRIRGADRGGSVASVSRPFTLSSSSSSIRPLPPIRPLNPPPPPGAGAGAPVASSGGDPEGREEPLPAGWQSVVGALVAIDVDPEPWLVRELAAAPDASVWQEAVRVASEYQAETPVYVSRCFATALRRWERAQGEAHVAPAPHSSPLPEPREGVPEADGVVVGVEVLRRPVAHPHPLSLVEVGDVVVGVARMALGRLWRSRGGSR